MATITKLLYTVVLLTEFWPSNRPHSLEAITKYIIAIMIGIDQWVSFLNPEPSTMANTIAIEKNNIIAEMIIRIMKFWNKLNTNVNQKIQ